jgi:creatinine amidohydrolase
MTDVFWYENLSWPEVAALDRHTPLIIPVGLQHNISGLAQRFGKEDRIGILPAIPFGWKGSGLEVPEALMTKFVGNLLDSIREDGFTQVQVLLPEGISLGLENIEVHSAIPQEKYTEIIFHPKDIEKVVIIPIGHTEQHGLHLPLNTDTICISAIAEGIAKKALDISLALPVFPYGVSMHRSSFAGTTSVNGRIFEDFWLSVINQLVSRGFEKIYLISGHGGNVSFLVNVVKYAGDRHPDIFCITTWLYLNGPKGQAALKKIRQSKIGGMGHACELETSLMLHLRPELVHMDRVVDETNFISTPSYYQDWIEGGVLIANPPWEDDTKTGAYGAGSLGTAQKGEFWLNAAIDEKIDHLYEIIEQYDRRKAKRLINQRKL